MSSQVLMSIEYGDGIARAKMCEHQFRVSVSVWMIHIDIDIDIFILSVSVDDSY